MSTLILTCDTGEGHNSCAKAIKEIYDSEGVPCQIVNPVRFVAEWFAKFVHTTHTLMYRNFPGVFRSGYQFTQTHGSQTTAMGSFPYWVLSKGADPLHEYILQHHVDRLICVHPLLMMMVSEQQRKYGLDIPTAYVSTDYTCCPGVKDGRPDYCFIPDGSLAEEFCCENIRHAQLVASGIPIRQQFYRTTEKRTAKAQFGIPEELPHLLLMCGSMGCGPMEEILEELSREQSFHISVVCGNNEALHRRLTEKYRDHPNLHILGFVKDISALMDSADLFVTKPGGLSSTEAAAKCLPAVYIDAVGGCELTNQEFFVRRGGAVPAQTPAQAAALCWHLMQDRDRRMQMQKALSDLALPNAARIIFETMR